MLRTGEEYRNSIRDGRNVWVDGKKVDDVPNPSNIQTNCRYTRSYL